MSKFSFPIQSMEQLIIHENSDDTDKDPEKDAEEIYRRFKDDGMEYYLILYMSNFKCSDDFSNNFSSQMPLVSTGIIFRADQKVSKEDCKGITINGKTEPKIPIEEDF